MSLNQGKIKAKVAELEGAALNWAVAECEGKTSALSSPSKLEAQSGDAILDLFDREEISISSMGTNNWRGRSSGTEQYASSFRVAGLRCFVAMKKGREIEVPAELLEQQKETEDLLLDDESGQRLG